MTDPDPITEAILRGFAQKEGLSRFKEGDWIYRVDVNVEGTDVVLGPDAYTVLPGWVRLTEVSARSIGEARSIFLAWAEKEEDSIRLVPGAGAVAIYTLAKIMRKTWKLPRRSERDELEGLGEAVIDRWRKSGP